MEQTLLNIVNTVLQNRGKKQIDNLIDATRLREDVGMDSLDLAEFTVRVEAEFGVDIFESGIVQTIGEVKEKIDK